MRRYLAPLGALLFILALVSASHARMTETEFYNFRNGMSPRGGLTVTYCGQNDENGVIYYSPASIAGAAQPALGDTACDALDGATEATQDLFFSNAVAVRPLYMRCATAATLGAGESMTFQLRVAEANVPGFACTIGAAGTGCDAAPIARFVLAKSAHHAMRVTQVSDNADDDGKCIVVYGIH